MVAKVIVLAVVLCTIISVECHPKPQYVRRDESLHSGEQQGNDVQEFARQLQIHQRNANKSYSKHQLQHLQQLAQQSSQELGVHQSGYGHNQNQQGYTQSSEENAGQGQNYGGHYNQESSEENDYQQQGVNYAEQQGVGQFNRQNQKQKRYEQNQDQDSYEEYGVQQQKPYSQGHGYGQQQYSGGASSEQGFLYQQNSRKFRSEVGIYNSAENSGYLNTNDQGLMGRVKQNYNQQGSSEENLYGGTHQQGGYGGAGGYSSPAGSSVYGSPAGGYGGVGGYGGSSGYGDSVGYGNTGYNGYGSAGGYGGNQYEQQNSDESLEIKKAKKIYVEHSGQQYEGGRSIVNIQRNRSGGYQNSLEDENTSGGRGNAIFSN